ncbi:Retrovirus-related Pol polyprotein from transposon 17.6, partial [Mucuna pruriens]
MGEKELMISTPFPTEYVEGDEEALETSFLALEIVGTTSAEVEEEGSKLPRAAIMVAKVLINNSFQPGKGLSKDLNDIAESVALQENPGRFRLGYTRVAEERRLGWKVQVEDKEKTTFITTWGTFYYKVMPFGLKNAGATYQRAMVTLFHDMMHKEVEVYVDDMITKLRTLDQHVEDLRKLFERLRNYRLKLNPAKCTFGVKTGKLLGFIVNQREIEVDPDKVKAIWNMPPPRTKTEVRGFLGRVNYITSFISQLTTTCSPIFKLLRNNQKMEWNEDCQEAFEKVKQYLEAAPVLVLETLGKTLILYLTVLEESIGGVLGQ